MIKINLSPTELSVLDRQTPSSKTQGGWQGLLVTLQERVRRDEASIVLGASELNRIRRYAFSYGKGGWESRLKAIFSRSLGSDLSAEG